MAYAAVTCLQNTILNLRDSRSSFLLLPHFEEILTIAYDQLKSLQQILKRLDASSKGRSRNKVNALDARIKEEVWKFEDLVESHVYSQILVPSDSDQILELNLVELGHDIDSFIEILKKEEAEYVSELDDMLREEHEASASATESVADSGGKKLKVVGSSSDILLAKIRSRLGFSNPLDVVPVVGMGGIGKTTIAMEVFDDPLLAAEFDCRAWVTVGRKRRLDKLKRDILTQLDPSMDRKIRGKGERIVDHYLKGVFKANKCLVVLDDVWEPLVRDEFELLIPDYGGGKNIVVLTTRLRHLGNFAGRKSSTVWNHAVALLEEDQSWDLLRQRVFGEEECPAEFMKSGQKIAQKCDGLPLMIVAVAALLSEAQMTAEFWEEVAEKANHPIFTAAYDQLYEVLIPSYEYLPQHLKPCFLQMGVFPQNHETRRSKLFCLWTAEGFLEDDHLNRRTMEDCFDTYLTELIDHSVAIICQTNRSFTYSERSDDSIKTCRLHSTFWHLCKREATATKFCRVLTTRDDGLHQLTTKGQRRLSFHNNLLMAMKDVVDSVEEACASSARSLLCYGPYNPYPVPTCFGLRLLKVLDALRLRFYEFPEQVIQLVYLKYFAITCNNAVPPSISRLWNLHFLTIHSNQSITLSRVTPYVPVEIWNMKQLRRIGIQGRNLPKPPTHDSEAFLIRLLSLVQVGAETCTREVLERIPNLKKLGVRIESHPDDNIEYVSDYLNNVHLLRKLTSLTCVVVNPTFTRTSVMAPLSMFPSSLKKLYLNGLGYSWDCMSIIGSLPNLEVLKLRNYAFRGPKWVVRYGEFRALKSLMIAGTDLVHLKVEARGLFSLQVFYLLNCYRLKHLQCEPHDQCLSLKIAMVDCSPSAVACLFEMQSRYRVAVFVRSSWKDGKSK